MSHTTETGNRLTDAETIELQGTRYFLLDDDGQVSEVDDEPLLGDAEEIDYRALMDELPQEHLRTLRGLEDTDRLPDDPAVRFYQTQDAPSGLLARDAWGLLIERLAEEAKEVDE